MQNKEQREKQPKNKLKKIQSWEDYGKCEKA